MSKIVITNVNANKKEFSKETKQTFSGVEMVNGVLVRNLDEFETKESLEEYGLNFGINLNRKYPPSLLYLLIYKILNIKNKKMI